MGYFSWKTNDSLRSISNRESNKKTFTVYLVDNNGNKWKECAYEGYGVFGGKDYYELLAEMNGKVSREDGIDLDFLEQCYQKENVYPNIVQDPDWKWINEKPENCEYQGFFYPEDDEEHEGYFD